MFVLNIDDSELFTAKDPDILEEKLGEAAESSTNWISDNRMLCSGEKTKLLIVTTRENRAHKLAGKEIRVTVCGKEIKESQDEKLLGIMMSSNMTWSTYLHGNKLTGKDKVVGLVPQLSQRVGMLAQLNKLMTRTQFQNTCEGLFTSKLLYCIPLYFNVWGIQDQDDSNRRSRASTKEDCRKLQILQNKILRMKTRIHDYRTPTNELLDTSGDLSVHQLAAFHTTMTVFKVVRSGKPLYLAKKMILRKPGAHGVFPQRQINTIQIDCGLSISRSGFLYRGAKLWNQLPENLRSETKPGIFRSKLKDWIKMQVLRKPP